MKRITLTPNQLKQIYALIDNSPAFIDTLKCPLTLELED